jgi:hypothetical protein
MPTLINEPLAEACALTRPVIANNSTKTVNTVFARNVIPYLRLLETPHFQAATPRNEQSGFTQRVRTRKQSSLAALPAHPT